MTAKIGNPLRPLLVSALSLFIAGNSLAAETSVQIVSKKQVYELFVQKTGLELKDLVSGIKGETTARKKIQKFSLKQNPDSVLASFEKQIEKMKVDCLRLSSSPTLCDEQAAEISKGSSLKEQSRKALAGELNPKALQWHLAVISYIVDEQVMEPMMKVWEGACDKPEKLNTLGCKASLANIGQFQELMSNMQGWNLKFYASAAAPKISESSILDAVTTYGK